MFTRYNFSLRVSVILCHFRLMVSPTGREGKGRGGMGWEGKLTTEATENPGRQPLKGHLISALLKYQVWNYRPKKYRYMVVS